MKGSNVFIGVLFVFLTSCINTQAKLSWEKLEGDIADAVCQIHVVRRKYDYLVPYRPRPYEEFRGSGFFISSDGEIITNNHVVMDALWLGITLPGCGKVKIPVKIVGQCPERDIALLKVTDEGFQIICEKLGVSQMTYLKLGDSDKVRRWDKVYAVGYPLGQKRLKGTKGIISGPEYFRHETYIQMDAAINFGSSGGPLINNQGEVIAVTTAGVPGAQSVGFSTPINHVKTILDDLRNKPWVFKPYLGVFCNRGTEEHAQYLNNPIPGGLYVYYVQPNSIADMAGVKPGDMFYKLNGYEIDEYGETTVPWSSERVPLHEIIERFAVGQMVTFQVYRYGQRLNLSAECVEPPTHTSDFQYGMVDYELLGGMTIMQLCENHFELIPANPYLLEFARPDKQTEPVLLVTSLIPGTEIERIGQIMPGTLIAEVNEIPVGTLDEFRQALRVSLKTGVIVIKTQGDALFVLSFERVMRDQHNLIQDRVCPPTKTFLSLWSELN